MSGVQCVRWHSRLADQRHVVLRKRSGQQQEEGVAGTSKSVLRSAGVLRYVTVILLCEVGQGLLHASRSVFGAVCYERLHQVLGGNVL